MTAKEVYNIRKALGEITGPEESVKIIKEFVEQQLDDKSWDWATTTFTDVRNNPNVTFTDITLSDTSWMASDYGGATLNDKDSE